MNESGGLTAAQARKSSAFERKMTLRRTNSGLNRPQEVTFIDYTMLYNLILRAIQNKTKNSFIIYDFTPPNSQNAFKGDNVIKISDYPDICEALLKGPENIKLIELQKMLPKPKEDLFSKRMRFYNFIVVNDSKDNEFSKIFESQVQQFFQDNEEIKMDTLLSGGMHKANEKFFFNSIENYIFENPQLQSSPEVKAWKMASTFQNIMKSNKIKELQIYKNDCQTFFKKYPFMRNYLENINTSSALQYPNEVFFGRFYYGNWKHASSEEVFKHTKITHVLNMTQEVENYFENSASLKVNYCKVSIEDLDEVNIIEHFEIGYRFLSQALEDPSSKVFVHCAQGKSRSATLVCVFFMRMYEWTFDQTIRYISDRREIACPNPGFTEQLRSFELRNFLFDGEDACIKRSSSNNYLHMICDLVEDRNVINENDDEDKSSQEEEEGDYYEEGSFQDKLYQDVQLRFSTSENTPINNIIINNSNSKFNQNITKEHQGKENQQQPNIISNEIEIK